MKKTISLLIISMIVSFYVCPQTFAQNKQENISSNKLVDNFKRSSFHNDNSSSEFKIIPLKQQTIHLVSKTNIGGNKRIIIPIELPKNTVSWYFSVISIGKTSEAINLGVQLSGTGFNFENVKLPEGSAYFDVFLMDQKNKGLFEDKEEDFEYIEAGSRKNLKEGKFEINDHNSGTWYLGFRNPKKFRAVEVSVEIVALIKN
jgi:hypothetical protein